MSVTSVIRTTTGLLSEPVVVVYFICFVLVITNAKRSIS
nr:MAG TPA: hypothetical protein [Caudoviricetes sp.]